MAHATTAIALARVVTHDDLDSISRAGLEHRLLAAARDGLSEFEVREEILHPNGRIAPASHAYESAILVLAGVGELLTEACSQPFAAPCTLVLPAGRSFGIANRGPRPIAMLRVLASAGRADSRVDGPATERR